MSVRPEELLAMRETLRSFLSIIDRSLEALHEKAPEEVDQFIAFVERQNENLGEALKGCLLELEGNRLVVSASAERAPFLALHRRILEMLLEEFYGRRLRVLLARLAA